MRKAIVALLCVGVLTSGCGSMIFHNPQDVIVTTNAPNAFIRGKGKLPGKIQLDRSKNDVLLVEAEGYQPKQIHIESHLSWWRLLTSVVLNGGHGLFTLFISTVVGCVMDAGTGAWLVIDPDEIDVELERASFQAKSSDLEPAPLPSRAEASAAPVAPPRAATEPTPAPKIEPAAAKPARPAPAPTKPEPKEEPTTTVEPIPSASPATAPAPAKKSANAFCTACGEKLDAAAKFCGGCGAKQ